MTEKASERPSRLGMRVGGALYVAVAVWSAFQARDGGDTSARALGPSAIQGLIGLVLIAGPEKWATSLKDVIALIIGASAAARVILTIMTLATGVGFAFTFTEPREVARSVGVAVSMLLLLVGRAGSLRVTVALLVLVGAVYLGVVLPAEFE